MHAVKSSQVKYHTCHMTSAGAHDFLTRLEAVEMKSAASPPAVKRTPSGQAAKEEEDSTPRFDDLSSLGLDQEAEPFDAAADAPCEPPTVPVGGEEEQVDIPDVAPLEQRAPGAAEEQARINIVDQLKGQALMSPGSSNFMHGWVRV